MFTFRRKKQRELYAPVNGCGIALDDVRDEVFSKRLMGDGCTFLPETT
ncbi:MAG: PTS glucose transporter subunit IIA, partial [[Clostridium] innocuum]